jgi:lactonase family protein with 7-bladed beta-propeller
VTRFVAALLAVAAAALTFGTPAFAATPAPGGLTQLGGPLGCLGGIVWPEVGIPDDHCAPLGGWSGLDTIVFAGPARSTTATLSPDGRFLYTASRGQQLPGPQHRYDSAIVVLARDPRDGSLHQLVGEGGCVSELRRHQCAGGRSLDHISALAVSPDGRSLYAVANVSSGVAIFRRDPDRGTLTQLPGSHGCVRVNPGTERCARGRAIGNADSVLVSADGRSVYVGGNVGDSATIAVFARDPAAGTLRQLTGDAGCVARPRTARALGCAPIHGLTFFDVPTQSPDGRFVYFSNPYGNGPVVGLGRDEATGRVTPLGPLCAACAPPTLAGSLAIAPNGAGAYVFSGEHGVITAFVRDQLTGLFAPAAPSIAFRCRPATRCDVGAMRIDATGGSAYLVSDRAIVGLDRDPATGRLEPIPGPSGCVAATRRRGCVRGRAFDDPTDLLIPADGRNAYAISDYSVGVFRRGG